ncbi:U2 snrnp component ist3, partial [Globisporangium splendens]
MSAPKFFDVQATDGRKLVERQLAADASGLVIQTVAGTRVRSALNEDEVVVMVGTGASRWLKTSHTLPVVMHSMKMPESMIGESRSLRAWFGKMTLLPSHQRILQNPNAVFDEHADSTRRYLLQQKDADSDVKAFGCATNRHLQASVTCTNKACKPKSGSETTADRCNTICSRNHGPDEAAECVSQCKCSKGGDGQVCWMLCVPSLPTNKCAKANQVCDGSANPMVVCNKPKKSTKSFNSFEETVTTQHQINTSTKQEASTRSMNVIAEIHRINERELELGVPFEASWHQKYKDSAWVYVGGLPFELSEGDVLCVLSQFGEIEDLNLVRDAKTGKSKGFAFVKYENQRSTVLAVDNMNGARILERVIRVDHVLKYKLPKEIQDREDAKEQAALSSDDDGDDGAKPKQRGLPGHAYEGKELNGKYDITHGHNVFAAPEETKKERKKRRKEEKKSKRHAKKVRKIEEKQAKLFAEIQQKRKAQREQELLQQQRQRDDDDAPGNVPVVEASATGWRGRLEPNAPRANTRRSDERGSTGPQDRKDGDSARDASYGGLKRTR